MTNACAVKCVPLPVLLVPLSTTMLQILLLNAISVAEILLCPSGAISYQDANAASFAKRKAYAARFKDVYEEVV